MSVQSSYFPFMAGDNLPHANQLNKQSGN